MKFKHKIKGTLAIAAVLFATTSAFAAETLRVGTTGGYLPFTSQNANGDWEGYDVDVAREVCKRTKMECEFVQTAWDGIIPALMTKRFDAILAGMSINDERRKKINFSVAYGDTPAWFISNKSSALQSAKTIDEVRTALKGKTLGMTTGSIYEAFAKANLEGVTLRFYPKQDEVNLDLQAGRLDAVMQDSVALQDFLKSDNGKGFGPFGPALTGADFPVLGEGLGIGMRKEDTALLELMNKAVSEMRSDGTIKTLSEKWTGVDMSPRH
jgi:lysine-arginine-ornithine-binding protein